MNAACISTASDRLVSLGQGGEFQCRKHMEHIVKESLRPLRRESREFLSS